MCDGSLICGFYIPELRWFLDAGVPTSQLKPECVFITHSHTDHSQMLALLVGREKPMHVFAPEKAVPFIRDYVASLNRMNQMESDYVDRSAGYIWHGVQEGASFRVPSQQKYSVEVIDCIHAVTSVGYLFSESRTKLKAEYRALSGREIGAIKKQLGPDAVNETVQVRQFAFLGDTTDAVFANHGALLGTYAVVFVECTFFTPGSEQAAAESFHMHWSAIKEQALKYPDTTYVLIHFSKRYDDKEILGFFENERAQAVDSTGDAAALSNIVPWAKQPRLTTTTTATTAATATPTTTSNTSNSKAKGNSRSKSKPQEESAGQH
eukprot:TRINITY_DN7620_c0_g2_i1.p1 TRINITY_DN7620_c0_g2~~TRINITY_DN7620_c0_g2_i1.p1  ORF type:complete len:322 (-),score=74.35 TRINITY_DN7620_c0_g2_i1:143-1108(-)